MNITTDLDTDTEIEIQIDNENKNRTRTNLHTEIDTELDSTLITGYNNNDNNNKVQFNQNVQLQHHHVQQQYQYQHIQQQKQQFQQYPQKQQQWNNEYMNEREEIVSVSELSQSQQLSQQLLSPSIVTSAGSLLSNPSATSNSTCTLTTNSMQTCCVPVASSSSSSDSTSSLGLKKLKNLNMNMAKGLECPICLEIYNTDNRIPMVLSCGHTLCLSCTEISKSIDDGLKIQCPFDNRFMTATKNFALLQILELQKGKSQNAAIVIRKIGGKECEICGGTDSEGEEEEMQIINNEQESRDVEDKPLRISSLFTGLSSISCKPNCVPDSAQG